MFALVAFAISSLGISAVSAADTAKVTIIKYVDGRPATALSANNSDFQMNAAWTINGTPGTGGYALSAGGYNGDPTPYQAMTSDLPNGSNYSTNEVMDATTGVTCDPMTTPYTLVGYTYGETLAEAQAMTPTMTAPSFTAISTDKFVIVWNHDCATHPSVEGELTGTVTGGAGNGTLMVTSIETVDSTATADGTFANGWKYVFNITVPSNENDISMKFADWTQTPAAGTIPAANNMRISSPQANNAGATVLVTAANTYTIPALTMVTDLDPTMDGIQVKVTVEVAVPANTINGVYTTNYGVRAQ